MTSVIHNCPKCERTWHCTGCDTRAEERLCDACAALGEAAKTAQIQRDLAEMEVWQAARSVRAIAEDLLAQCHGLEAVRALCSALDKFDALIEAQEAKAKG